MSKKDETPRETCCDEKNLVDSALEIAMQVPPQHKMEIDGKIFIARHENFTGTDITEEIESLKPNPRRKNGEVKLITKESFILFLQEFKTPVTRIFLSPSEGRLEAVLNYHEKPVFTEDRAHPGIPGWGDDTVSLSLQRSPEWAIWTANNKKNMSQGEFAEFIEDNLKDILHPSGASLLETTRKLNFIRNINFNSNISLQDGLVQMQYSEENGKTDKPGTMVIPEIITLGIAPFLGEPPYKITARLRFRINSGSATFFYILNKPELIIDDCLKNITGEISETTKLPVYWAAAD